MQVEILGATNKWAHTCEHKLEDIIGKSPAILQCTDMEKDEKEDAQQFTAACARDGDARVTLTNCTRTGKRFTNQVHARAIYENSDIFFCKSVIIFKVTQQLFRPHLWSSRSSESVHEFFRPTTLK